MNESSTKFMMRELNLLLLPLVLLPLGCGKTTESKSVEAPLISNKPVSSSNLNLSEALPSLDKNESFSSLTKNDLVDGFYYYGSRSQEVNSSNESVLRIRLSVLGDKACYLATGLEGTDFEVESLVRESPGVWRGFYTNRLFTQPILNSLTIYETETNKVGDYTNNQFQSDNLRLMVAEFKKRNRLVDNITKLSLQDEVEAVYRKKCLGFQPIYFRGKPTINLTSKERNQIQKIESELDTMLEKEI